MPVHRRYDQHGTTTTRTTSDNPTSAQPGDTVPINIDFSHCPRPTTPRRQEPAATDQPTPSTATEDTSTPRRDIKASFRHAIEERGKRMIEAFHERPGDDLYIGTSRKAMPQTGARNAFINALAAYLEREMNVEIEVHEFPDRDGDIVTTISIAASSLVCPGAASGTTNDAAHGLRHEQDHRASSPRRSRRRGDPRRAHRADRSLLRL